MDNIHGANRNSPPAFPKSQEEGKGSEKRVAKESLEALKNLQGSPSKRRKLDIHCQSFEHPFERVNIRTVEDIANFYPMSVDEVKVTIERAKKHALSAIEGIMKIPDSERTFENTIKALDEAKAYFKMHSWALESMEMVHKEKDVRDAAGEGMKELETFLVKNFSCNKKLYLVCKAYCDGNMLSENLSEERRYYLDGAMKVYKRQGLELEGKNFERVIEIKSRLSELTTDFSTNAKDCRTIKVTLDDLKGMDEDFIKGLKQENGLYILGTDYPTAFPIFRNCQIESTRKALYHEFNNRAMPKNKALLREILNLRDELAELIGYESYAHMNIEGKMAEHPLRVEEFWKGVIPKAQEKAEKEFALLLADLPPSVSLTKDGKVKPWDMGFLITQYEKKNLQVDDEKIAKYFPLESTIEGLFNIYESFFDIEFTIKKPEGLWDESLSVFEVNDKKSGEMLGHIALDLFPREGKYSHACCCMAVPPTSRRDGSLRPALATVVANFPKSVEDKPAFLKHSDVKTFFHEFGHAIHVMVGRTEMPSVAGYESKWDFVEMPSQILEEWLWDKEILQKLSKHYETGKPLPDELINSMIKARTFGEGYGALKQIVFANMSMHYHLKGKDKDTKQLHKQFVESLIPQLAFYPDDNMENSFGHLMHYIEGYYGYMWSKVFAMDCFDHIKKQNGLLDPKMGRRYIWEIIGRGGSVDPSVMVRRFLGREPSPEAFLKSLG